MKTNRGITVAMIMLYIAIIGISGAATYIGLFVAFPKEEPATQAVRTTRESTSAPSQSSQESALKPGALAPYIGDGFAESLKDCTEGSFTFKHALTDETLKRTIKTGANNICQTTEEMPNNGSMTCTYTAAQLTSATAYYAAIYEGNDMSSSFKNGKSITVVDGKTLDFDLNILLQDGTCTVTGYE